MFWCINTDFYDIIAYVNTSKAWKGGMRSKKQLQFNDLLTNESLIYSYLPKPHCGFKQRWERIYWAKKSDAVQMEKLQQRDNKSFGANPNKAHK